LKFLLRNSKIIKKQFKIQIKKILVKKIHKQIKKKIQIISRMIFNKIKRKLLIFNTRIIVVKTNNLVAQMIICVNKIQNNNPLNNKLEKIKKLTRCDSVKKENKQPLCYYFLKVF